MNPKLIAAALVIICLPVCAHAQKPTAAKVTNADAQKVVKMIGSDKAKIQIYCDVAELGDQIDETNSKDKKKIDELNQRMDELAAKLGPEYVALVGGLERWTRTPRTARRSIRRSKGSTNCARSSKGFAFCSEAALAKYRVTMVATPLSPRTRCILRVLVVTDQGGGKRRANFAPPTRTPGHVSAGGRR